MVSMWFGLMFIACAALSLLLCSLAWVLFPRFCSGEIKYGPHRPDLADEKHGLHTIAEGYDFDKKKGPRKANLPDGERELKSVELPLVGGPALVLALEIMGIVSGFVLHFSTSQWTLLLIGLGTTFGFMLLGFIDDWHKYFSKEGLSQRTKFIGVLSISMAAALCYFFLLPAGRQPYGLYMDFPILGSIVCPTPHANVTACNTIPQFGQLAYFVWLIVLVGITSAIGSFTSLSVDFSDGLDGLAGGLVFSAAIAFGIIITGELNQPVGIVLEVLSLLCAASTLGFLPLNWPSSWAARPRRSPAKRTALIYMGDSGALALGGILAIIALFSREEVLLLMVGGAFVLEGLSALISAKVMARFVFRRGLILQRFASMNEFVPHTEFPLPFLATPLHHHFDLLGWDRRRLVYGAWALGACFALLGVMVGTAPETWERYLGRILVLILAWLVWSSGSWTRKYFIGKHPAERRRRRRLALFYGYPYTLFGISLFKLVEIIEASEDVIETPAEEVALWHRMSIFDARAMLGLYCYRAGYYPAALAQWTHIPEVNRALRPEIARLLADLDSRLALEKQETQPMRRDQILQAAPVLTGSLSPADLPNPHEPIGSSKPLDLDMDDANDNNDNNNGNGNGDKTTTAPRMPSYRKANDQDQGEQYPYMTPIYLNEAEPLPSAYPSLNGNGTAASMNAITAPLPSTPSNEGQKNWFSRRRRMPSGQ
jgi:UDP-N-acetylmuramyl pentapeptide phosphotransferase/UDP-N-acetylglucosamine-1-phosphate transferase